MLIGGGPVNASVRPQMYRSNLLPILCLWGVLSGCAPAPAQRAKLIPAKIDRLIVYSLECDFDWEDVSEDAELLHGYLVLGSAEIDTEETKTEIANAIRTDIATATDVYMCFDPHHAIRIFSDDGTTDVVICYRCRGYETTKNGKLVTLSYPMNVQSRELLNRVLTSYGVALSPGANAESKASDEQIREPEPPSGSN
jgi:hypothetical protein